MKIIISILLISNFLIMPVSAQVTSSFWQTKKLQHFIIYYQEAPVSFVDELGYKAEDYYNGIVDELGFRRFDFWSWDNRAKIYLFNNSHDYLDETHSMSWSGAQVSVKDRVIKTFIGQEFFLDSMLPHEMSHIIFREFVGLNINLPLWLDEGVACSQEKNSLALRMQAAKALVRKDSYLKFDKLSELHDSSSIQPDVFYSEAASIIVFLLTKYDKDYFLNFSRKLRDGIEWKKAILDSYHFADLAEFETAWKDFLLTQ
ncbi:MAG: peptidase MA family metallohydrolase [Candidatus Omnitrophota bacterium]|nr:peptidase MA family metallohydrolase [Candidatus Omnitrophota bacterium]